MEHSQLSDEALLDHIHRGDVQAIEQLYDRHAQPLYNLIARIVRDPATAEAVLQETFWQVWKKAGDYDGTGLAAAWLYRIARNRSLDQLRRQRARPQAVALPGEEQGEFSDAPGAAPLTSVEADVERLWIRQDLRQALATIPDEQRLCLELAYFEGMSQSQIAEYTETPLGTIKTRVRMGLQKLERILRTAGYERQDV